MKEQIESWIKQLSLDNNSDPNIVALYFGLYETLEGYCLYIVGSYHFEEDNDDWACSVYYEPQMNFLELKDVKSTMNWECLLNFVCGIISDYIAKPEISNSPLFNNRIIAIGFDDGPLRIIKKD